MSIKIANIDELYDFEDNPYQVKDNEDMKRFNRKYKRIWSYRAINNSKK